MPSRSKKKAPLYLKKVTNVDGFLIPQSGGALRRIWQEAKIPSIHELEQGFLGSGSMVTETQFLSLRVVYRLAKEPKDLRKCLSRYGHDEVWIAAEDLVADSAELQTYLNLIDKAISVANIEKGDELHPGEFKLVKTFQEQLVHLEQDDQKGDDIRYEGPPPPEYKDTDSGKGKGKGRWEEFKGTLSRKAGRKARETIRQLAEEDSGPYNEGEPDEEYTEEEAEGEARLEKAPNMALILLLEPLSELVKNSGVEWSIDDVKFSPSFGKGFFNTWTDGTMRVRSSHETLAIVEVKKRSRGIRTKDIILQEGRRDGGMVCE
ncbi:hypothetical protein ZTR_10093 [Talaromyces verruculosus]|nr:hypothetical protein ZTR_10093 [Talaromyces verruculosus]